LRVRHARHDRHARNHADTEKHADEQLYDKKVYIFTTALKEMNGALGVAASPKTNRIGFEKYRSKIALEPQQSLLSKSS
jgi:hypothetical protein